MGKRFVSIGEVKTIPEALEALRQTNAAQPGDGWLIGFGYDDTMLAEQRHFTREDLDRVSTDRTILAMHISGHMAVVNSLALERFGITAETPDPPGGEIRKDSETGEPTGLLLELNPTALMSQISIPTWPYIGSAQRSPKRP